MSAAAGYMPMSSARELAGYDLTSVWPRKQDGPCPFKPFALPVPSGYRRSAFHTLERVVRTYMRPGDVFLETCAGWFTFACTAVMHGYSGTGVDVWDESINFARAQRIGLPPGARERLSIEQGDALALSCPDDTFDYAYSSLPAFRLQKYSDHKAAIEAAADRAGWAERIFDLFVETARVVKPGGLITTLVEDRRTDGVLVPEHAYVLQAAAEAGLALHDLAVQHLVTSQQRFWRAAYDARRTAKAHEYVLTFKVGKP